MYLNIAGTQSVTNFVKSGKKPNGGGKFELLINIV